MTEFHRRMLPRLMLDTSKCLQLAQGDLDADLRTQARDDISSLLQMDVTDIESAVAALRTVAHHLRKVEEQLDAAGRPFAMRKVRSVRERVEHATLA